MSTPSKPTDAQSALATAKALVDNAYGAACALLLLADAAVPTDDDHRATAYRYLAGELVDLLKEASASLAYAERIS